jgi:pimeloyl-ACP methyl ester carboxylesterase
MDEFVDIGGRRLFTRVRGSGPGVVLMAGAGTAGVGGWEPLDSQLARFATVVAYDRAGTGWSDPPPSAPSAADMVLDLHALLTALRLTFPVVLVGRSLGALPAQLYACEYPAEVQGLVLLDPTPDLMLSTYYAPPSTSTKARREPAAANGHLERQRIVESSAQVRRAIEEQRRMPDVPVVVLTAGIRSDIGTADAIVDSLLLAHHHMAARVPQGRLQVAENSSHTTLVSADCELIVTAVQSIFGSGTDRASS